MGIVLLRPKPPKNPSWRIRWRCPDTGKPRERALTTEESASDKTRREAKRSLASTLSVRRHELRQGAQPVDNPLLGDAIAAYFAGVDISAKTRRTYRDACDHFLRWCTDNNIKRTHDVTVIAIRQYRASLLARPKKVCKKGGRLGETRMLDRPISRWSVNKELKALSAVLGYLRRDRVLRLTKDDLSDALERYDVKLVRRPFLDRAQIQQLLAACKEHDRWHHPVRDFVLYVLLSGIRVKASLRIEASDVLGTDLHVRAEISKTEHTVDMTISPMLAKLVARRPWDGHTYCSLEAARRRLKRYGAPEGWSWHSLRRTCGTFLVAMPTLGSSSIIFASQQLGHSAEVAQRHYWGRVRVPHRCKTLEQAMGL
ncbi:MAG TPA: hypothetical protein VFN67_01080, partial [Polyangiales bacterium]|nr:hypothetical protein [Polyangiales bacterium]